MNSILISGSPTWTDRKRVQQVVDDVPNGWVVITGNARGLDQVVQGCVNARMHLTCEVVTRREDESVPQMMDRMVAKANYSVIFRGDGIGAMLAMRCKTAHIRATIVDGPVLDARIAAIERAKVSESVAHVQWKREESADRDAFFDNAAVYHSDGVDYHAHDVLNPEREQERAVWLEHDRAGRLDPHAHSRVVGATSIHRTVGSSLRVAAPPRVVWETNRWQDPFAEEGELVNLEDFTMDECGIIDAAMHLGYARKIGWRIEHGVPLSRELFEEMAAVVQNRTEGWQQAEEAMKELAS